MKTDFLACGNHFLPFSQTTVNYCQWKQFSLQLEHIFQPILHSSCRNEFFVYWKQYFFVSSFFQLMENITEIWGKSNFKGEPYSASGHQFFFLSQQAFFKVDAMLPYSKSVFFNNLCPATAKEFSANGNSMFLFRTILLLLEITSVINSQWQHFFFLVVETSVSTKSFIPARENGFSGQ